MRFLPANAQHIGDRHSQQDSFGFGDPDDGEFVAHGGFLAVVCDGMGGMEFGDAASRAAIRAFLDAYREKTAAESIPSALERSVRTANNAVVALAHSYGLSEGMGTTLVAAVFHDSAFHYVSVGDSGLFLLHGGALRMVNYPHVFANLLDAAVARGTMSRADAETHPERESLTSFIGAESLEEIDRNGEPIPLAEGDVVLLASDGLFKTLPHDEMLSCLQGDPQSWAEALVARTIAKEREHQDNVTVLSIAAESESGAVIGSQASTERIRAGAPLAATVPRAGVFGPTPVETRSPAPSRSRMPILLLIAVLLLAAGGAWWYFHRGRAPALTASPSASDPGSAASAPPRTAPVEIKIDPDAPVDPASLQASPSVGKATESKASRAK